MRTERQREASRVNGARSRGPVTNIGKQKSSRNSLRYGLYAKEIPAAPPVHDEAVRDELETLYPAPNSPDSEYDFLLQRAHDAHRHRMRIVLLETRIMNEEIHRQCQIHPEETATNLAAFAFRRLADETGTLHALYRCEGVMARRWERALERLDLFCVRAQRFQTAFFQKNKISETNLTDPPCGDLSLTASAVAESAACGIGAEEQSAELEIEKINFRNEPGKRAAPTRALRYQPHPPLDTPPQPALNHATQSDL